MPISNEKYFSNIKAYNKLHRDIIQYLLSNTDQMLLIEINFIFNKITVIIQY